MKLALEPLVIARDHPALDGHFPGQPIVPGVILLDEALHAIGRELGGSVERWHLSSVKFHRAVAAGEALRLQYSAREDGSTEFELLRGETRVVSGQVTPVQPTTRA